MTSKFYLVWGTGNIIGCSAFLGFTFDGWGGVNPRVFPLCMKHLSSVTALQDSNMPGNTDSMLATWACFRARARHDNMNT